MRQTDIDVTVFGVDDLLIFLARVGKCSELKFLPK